MEEYAINNGVTENMHQYAANLMVNHDKNTYEVEQLLCEKGVDRDTAKEIVAGLSFEIEKARKDQANKDMLYGALWCIGGTVLTLADIGFIFWGAIVVGGVQFLKGLINYMK